MLPLRAEDAGSERELNHFFDDRETGIGRHGKRVLPT
jgi:hypothetical protein